MNKEIIKIRIYQLQLCILLFVGWLLSRFMSRKELWLISERGHEARDNASVFYEYMKTQHPEKSIKYVISRDSKDIKRIDSDDIIDYGSLMHYIYLWRSTHQISTHICGYTPDLDQIRRISHKLHLFTNKVRIFLQHGIIMNNLPYLYGDNIDIDMFVCGAKLEYDYVVKNFRHKPGIVKYTGLCRYDRLVDYRTRKQVLLMPTWRVYIDKENFEDSVYFKQYAQLLTSSTMHQTLSEYGYELVFYPHYEVQRFINLFKRLPLPDNVHIADFNNDVQSLLKESAMLITDYSSVFFDMAYMEKPLVFFPFDEKDFYSKHYSKGYFDFEKAGDVVRSVDDMVRVLREILKNGCEVNKLYKAYMDQFFVYRDTKNCQRVYNAIENIKK